MKELEKENAKLRFKLGVLQKRFEVVSKELDRLRAVQPFKRGLEGEHYVAALIGGKITIANARHDVITRTGLRLEVKLARLRYAVHGKRTKEWAWSNILGRDGQKVYDRLILLGEADERYAEVGVAYAIFDIPYSEVIALIPRSHDLHLTTNPRTVRSQVSAILYQSYQITEATLGERYK